MAKRVQIGCSPHVGRKQVRKQMKEKYGNSERLHGKSVVSKNPDVVVTYTQDEVSLEGGRECCCVMAVVAIGFGGDRGRRGGFA